MKNIFAKILFLFGVVLIGLNVYGLFIPLRNSDIYIEEQTYFRDDITLTEKQLLKLLKKNKETDEIFILKVNNAINKGIAHYWKEEGINKYNFRIPIYENYILFIASYINPTKFRKYEFSNYQKAIERGVGLCSQHAIILSEVLENNGIDSKVVNISRHVVVTAQVDKNKKVWWVLDSDYGVVIKNDIIAIEKEPDIIRPYYFDKGYDTLTVNTITNSYSKIIGIYNSAFEYSGKKRYYFEKLSYIGIWLIPITFILTSIIFKNKRFN